MEGFGAGAGVGVLLDGLEKSRQDGLLQGHGLAVRVVLHQRGDQLAGQAPQGRVRRGQAGQQYPVTANLVKV